MQKQGKPTPFIHKVLPFVSFTEKNPINARCWLVSCFGLRWYESGFSFALISVLGYSSVCVLGKPFIDMIRVSYADRSSESLSAIIAINTPSRPVGRGGVFANEPFETLEVFADFWSNLSNQNRPKSLFRSPLGQPCEHEEKTPLSPNCRTLCCDFTIIV